MVENIALAAKSRERSSQPARVADGAPVAGRVRVSFAPALGALIVSITLLFCIFHTWLAGLHIPIWSGGMDLCFHLVVHGIMRTFVSLFYHCKCDLARIDGG